MKQLFFTKDSSVNQISYYHLVLLTVTLPFNMYYSHLVLISYILHTLIHLKKSAIKPVFIKQTLVLQSVFFVTVLSTIYTINIHEAFNEWGKQITILLFPLVCYLNPFELKKYRSQILMWFSLACVATILYLYADAIITIRYYGLPLTALFSAAFTNHNFSEPIGIHATFFSMQVGLALVYFLYILTKADTLFKRMVYLLCSAILTAGIIQLGAKSVFVALILIVNIAVPYFLLRGTNRWKFIVASVAISVLACAVILKTGALRERYIKELETDLSARQQGVTTDSRLARWKVSAELISKRPLTGYGAGSEIGLLQDSFFNNKLYSSYLNRLNTHSEYLSFLIKSGIIGLLIYLGTIAYGFTIAFRQKDLLLFAFMALITCVSVSENLLDVDKGIFFYALFFSFFVFSNRPQKSGLNPQKSVLIFHEAGNQLVN